MGRSYLREDIRKHIFVLYKTDKPSASQIARCFLLQFNFPCLAVYRFGHWSWLLLRRSRFLGAVPTLVYIVLDYLVRLLYHVEISRKTRIGPGLYLGHPSTIFIGPTSIGRNCSMTHNVTIGWGLGAQAPGMPMIGDDVWIGPGSVITGDIAIGNGVAISAGSIVSRSIPDNCLVAGNPARVIQSAYDNRALLAYSLTPEVGPVELEVEPVALQERVVRDPAAPVGQANGT